jgi:hypothetical protein
VKKDILWLNWIDIDFVTLLSWETLSFAVDGTATAKAVLENRGFPCSVDGEAHEVRAEKAEG